MKQKTKLGDTQITTKTNNDKQQPTTNKQNINKQTYEIQNHNKQQHTSDNNTIATKTNTKTSLPKQLTKQHTT